MSKTVSAYKARTNFGEILDDVRYRREPVIVEKNGRPAVVIIDLETYRSLEALREEEKYIEEYSDDRVREFLAADRLSPAESKRIKRFLKSTR